MNYQRFRVVRREYTVLYEDRTPVQDVVWEGENPLLYSGGLGCFDEHPCLIIRALEFRSSARRPWVEIPFDPRVGVPTPVVVRPGDDPGDVAEAVCGIMGFKYPASTYIYGVWCGEWGVYELPHDDFPTVRVLEK